MPDIDYVCVSKYAIQIAKQHAKRQPEEVKEWKKPTSPYSENVPAPKNNSIKNQKHSLNKIVFYCGGGEE